MLRIYADVKTDARFLQAVLIKQHRSAAVGTNAVMAIVQAKHCASGFLQFIVMRLPGQFFLRKVGSIQR